MSINIEGVRKDIDRKQRYDTLVDLRDQQIQGLNGQFVPGIENVQANISTGIHLKKATDARARNEAKRDALETQIQDAREGMLSGLSQAEQLVSEGFYPKEVFDAQQAEFHSIFTQTNETVLIPEPTTSETEVEVKAEAETAPWQLIPIPVNPEIISELLSTPAAEEADLDSVETIEPEITTSETEAQAGQMEEQPLDVPAQSDSEADKVFLSTEWKERKRGEKYEIRLPDGSVWITGSAVFAKLLPRILEGDAPIESLAQLHSGDINERSINAARSSVMGKDSKRLKNETGIEITNIGERGSGGIYRTVKEDQQVTYPPINEEQIPAEEVEVYSRFSLRRVPDSELNYAYEVLRGEHEKTTRRPKEAVAVTTATTLELDDVVHGPLRGNSLFSDKHRRNLSKAQTKRRRREQQERQAAQTTTETIAPISEVEKPDLKMGIEEAAVLMITLLTNKQLIETYEIDDISKLTYDRIRSKASQLPFRTYTRQEFDEIREAAVVKFSGIVLENQPDSLLDEMDPDVSEFLMHFMLHDNPQQNENIKELIERLKIYGGANIFRADRAWSYDGARYQLNLPEIEGENIFSFKKPEVIQQTPDSTISEPVLSDAEKRANALLAKNVKDLERRDPHVRLHLRNAILEVAKYKELTGPDFLASTLSQRFGALDADFLGTLIKEGVIKPSRDRKTETSTIWLKFKDAVLARYSRKFKKSVRLNPNAFGPALNAIYDQIAHEIKVEEMLRKK